MGSILLAVRGKEPGKKKDLIKTTHSYFELITGNIKSLLFSSFLWRLMGSGELV
jgi:hypothetical protein